MNKLEKTPTSNPPPTTHAGVQNTPVIHTHIVEGLDSTNKQNAPTQVHMYTYTRVYIHTCICIHIHRHTYVHIHTYEHAHTIHAYMHTHMHMHVFAHLHTDRKSQQQRLNASSNIIDAHTNTYKYACIYTYIRTYIYAHPAASVFADVYADVEETPVERIYLHMYWCTEHLFQCACNTQCKKMHIHIYLHTYAHAYTYAHEYTCACMTLSTH